MPPVAKTAKTTARPTKSARAPLDRDKSNRPLTVSIIIATANRAVSLDRTLYSLRQIRYPHFEVVISDGPSHDHTAEIAAKHADFVRYYPCTKPNLSAARNIGLAHARGDISIFIDDDAIPEPDWLDRLLTGFENPNVAQVGGFIRDHNGINYQCKYVIADRFGNSASYDEIEGELNKNRYLSLTGTNFAARTDCLMKIGGFDEEFIYYLDETDVNLRLVDEGWDAVVIPDAEIHHKFAPSHMRSASRVPRTMYPQLRSKAYFCCVHGLKNHTLDEVVSYISHYTQLERNWKGDLLTNGMADQATVARLIDDVERGVRDGVRDAFYYSGPQGITAELKQEAAGSVFKPFPLPMKAEDRLRICLMSQDYPPVGNGGIGQWTHTVATGLAARGHEVTVISRSDTDFSYIDFIDGVWVHRIVPTNQALAQDPKYASAPGSLIDYSASLHEELLRINERRRFQVVSGPIFDFESLVTLRESSIPTVVSLHTTYKLGLPHKPDWLQNPEYKRLHVDKAIDTERTLLQTAPHLLANTSQLVKDIELDYGISIEPARLTTVPHGLTDLSVGVKPFPKPATDEVRLLFVGRLEMRKGADLVLDALPELLKRFPKLVVDIVGDDGIQINGKTLRKGFEERYAVQSPELARVTFHGTVSREDLLRHYASCDVFVAPSRYESFGLIFAEAMMFGKPSVGIRVGGVSEVVTHEVNGLLIDSPDVSALTQSIARLVEDKALRTRLGANGRKTYEDKFTAEKMIDALEAYYRRLATRTPAVSEASVKEAIS